MCYIRQELRVLRLLYPPGIVLAAEVGVADAKPEPTIEKEFRNYM